MRECERLFLADAALALVHGDGVEDADGGTVLQELVNDRRDTFHRKQF